MQTLLLSTKYYPYIINLHIYPRVDPTLLLLKIDHSARGVKTLSSPPHAGLSQWAPPTSFSPNNKMKTHTCLSPIGYSTWTNLIGCSKTTTSWTSSQSPDLDTPSISYILHIYPSFPPFSLIYPSLSPLITVVPFLFYPHIQIHAKYGVLPLTICQLTLDPTSTLHFSVKLISLCFLHSTHIHTRLFLFLYVILKK